MSTAPAPRPQAPTPTPLRFGSLILALVLLLLTGAIALVTVERIQASREQVLHTYYVRGLLKDLRSEIDENHANFNLYQLSRNPDEAGDLEIQAKQQLQTVEQLRTLTRDSPGYRIQLEQFGKLLDEDLVQLRSCVKERNCLGDTLSSVNDQMAAIFARRKTMSAMLQDMENNEAQLLEKRLQTWNSLFTRMIITLIGSFVLALVLLLYSFNLLIREIERRKHQEWLEKKNAESYRMLSARILELQDVERRKIARELHDSVGQFLAGLKLNLGRLQRRDATTTGHNHLLAESVDLTDRAITEVRTISHLLHPPLLDELGFYSALRWYTEGFAKRSEIVVELHLTEIVDRLPREIELALFRVLQESLTNVHRHANATHVDVDVRCSEDEVILTVSDNGHGINRKVLENFRAGQAGGIGLAGMRERLAELGGTLSVESSSNGTQIRALARIRRCETQDAAPVHLTATHNAG
ncbi:MAG TPA: ATP-binding protein [Candidatus Sulfotelmatobacter sp.]|nr:ATP-binding protein [Candidatus Sulfotelmatobacter sp.]